MGMDGLRACRVFQPSITYHQATLSSCTGAKWLTFDCEAFSREIKSLLQSVYDGGSIETGHIATVSSLLRA